MMLSAAWSSGEYTAIIVFGDGTPFADEACKAKARSLALTLGSARPSLELGPHAPIAASVSNTANLTRMTQPYDGG
jgi:hypothetical protein